tara:strand:- start:187 stop:507 length:321 start_codon:yes stop_codon:yes gene_type:complete
MLIPKTKKGGKMICAKYGSRRQVFNGSAIMTQGGLTKRNLLKKNGRIIAKKKSTVGKKNSWAAAMKSARAKLIKSGTIKKGEFVALNKGVSGKTLYKETLKLHKSK